MGYRSEVCLRVNKKAVSESAWEKIKEFFEDYHESLFSEGEYDGAKFYQMHIYDVKWYNMFPEVEAVKNLTESFLDDDEFGLLIIGEETGDIEEDGDLSTYGMYAEVQQSVGFFY